MLTVVVVVRGLASVAAARWCSDYFPDAIFCDDFDRYCTNPPPSPGDAWESGSQTSNGALQAVWSLSSTNPNGPCGTTFTVETDTRPRRRLPPATPARAMPSSVSRRWT